MRGSRLSSGPAFRPGHSLRQSARSARSTWSGFMIQTHRGGGVYCGDGWAWPDPRGSSPATSPDQAVADADIICTATTSRVPVFPDRSLSPGFISTALAPTLPKCRRSRRRPSRRALVVVDSLPAALAEAGDLIQPLDKGSSPASISKPNWVRSLGKEAGPNFTRTDHDL